MFSGLENGSEDRRSEFGARGAVWSATVPVETPWEQGQVLTTTLIWWPEP